jgi:hypothetical protein
MSGKNESKSKGQWSRPTAEIEGNGQPPLKR